MKKKRKIWRWIILAAVVLAVIVFFMVRQQSARTAARYAEETVRTGSIETYYNFSGNVAVRNSQTVNAKTNATVREIFVDEDDVVTEGTPLLRLSNGDVIKAEIDGEVTDVHVSRDDAVSIGTAMVEIIDFDDLQVIMKVDEYDVMAVTVGREAAVTIDALGITFDSRVEHISKQVYSATASSGDAAMSGMMMSAGASGSDVSYYEAKLSAPEDERILPGMKVDVRILDEQVDNAVLLSMSALQFDAYNKPYVYMRGSGNAVTEVAVSVGVQDGTTVQITSGLRSGDVVLVPQSQLMFSIVGG